MLRPPASAILQVEECYCAVEATRPFASDAELTATKQEEWPNWEARFGHPIEDLYNNWGTVGRCLLDLADQIWERMPAG